MSMDVILSCSFPKYLQGNLVLFEQSSHREEFEQILSGANNETVQQFQTLLNQRLMDIE
jgi:hypothetical protein